MKRYAIPVLAGFAAALALGLTQIDRWSLLPSSQNVEDRRFDAHVNAFYKDRQVAVLIRQLAFDPRKHFPK